MAISAIGVSAVLSTELSQPGADLALGAALEIKWWVQRGKHVGLQASEGVGVFGRDSHHSQVRIHPSGQLGFVDGGPAVRSSQDRSKGATEGRELMAATEVHSLNS